MLEGKVIMVTGASSGIGLATAQVCVRLGAVVLMTGRDDERLSFVAQELGENAIPMSYDATDEEQVKAAFGHIKAHIGFIDGLVNNAGQMLEAAMPMTRLSALREQLDANTIAAYQHTQLASRFMLKRGGGCIINLCSIVGEHGAPGQTAYATAKAAVSGMTKAASKELAPHNIRVNGVAPGFIETPMTQHFEPEKRQGLVGSIGLGRAGTAQEVADLISFLLSDHASYITGQIIGIDGGMRL